MRPSRVILVLALAHLLGIASARAQDPCTSAVEPKGQAGAYSFWTGPRDGYYDKVGHALAYSAAHSGIKIDPVISNGSVENICALVQGRADFALVQSDAAHLASFGEEPFSQKYTAPTMVTPIFVEKVHVLIRPHLYIASPAGLTRPHSVWMGPENSGSQLSAQLVLLASGKSQAEIAELKATPSPNNFDEALKSLTLYTRGFSSLVASTAALIATGRSEPVPGQVYPCCGPAPFTAHPIIPFIWTWVQLVGARPCCRSTGRATFLTPHDLPPV